MGVTSHSPVPFFNFLIWHLSSPISLMFKKNHVRMEVHHQRPEVLTTLVTKPKKLGFFLSLVSCDPLRHDPHSA